MMLYNMLHTYCTKKQEHRGALNVELYDAVQHASYLLY